MSETIRPFNEIDAYIATFSDEEHDELAAAETSLDLACILYQIRQEEGLTQQKAAEMAGLKQQAISRLEKAASNIQLSTLQRYLGALGYSIEISVIDNHTGNVAGKTTLSRA
ncbi:MAG TPA: helix-turn-helix transcriptional regulator [Ktedonobacteraceae bacterium]|nr:helix-turn-helix transcriptional regulator [Ktedonobacteraceae bacterium]